MRAFVRGFSGAFLFGIPLLYTMEMWWLGNTSETGRQLVILIAALLINFAVASASGFKEKSSPLHLIDQAIDAVAIGAVGSVIVLIVLNRISLDDPLESVLGKVIVQILPLSIGVSVANIVFRGREGRTGEEGEADTALKAFVKDVGGTALGAAFIGSTIAPTDEIPMLAAGLDYPHVIGVILLSLLVAYLIVFASGFDPASAPGKSPGIFQHPLTETTLSYLVGLVVSFGALLIFAQVTLEDPVYGSVKQVLVLGLPAAIGGAAGRVAL